MPNRYERRNRPLLCNKFSYSNLASLLINRSRPLELSASGVLNVMLAACLKDEIRELYMPQGALSKFIASSSAPSPIQSWAVKRNETVWYLHVSLREASTSSTKPALKHSKLHGRSLVMRLINTETLELLEFWGDKIPKYAILSHTWEEGEVTFQDWHHPDTAHRMKKKGYYKVDMACKKAQKHGLGYLWCDTNCIDKSSSSELSEAINSMFRWYQKASVCYVYLVDVEPMPKEWEHMTEEYVEKFSRSRWFTRGWTLQELLAPEEMTFYSQDWSKIASRSTMAEIISETTKISTLHLKGDGRYKDASIAQKMSWISQRHTSRIEDMAYCMLGIFDINMPLLYGEGPKAFVRLQEEIIRTSNDQTIFCWTWIDSVPQDWVSLLAPCPQAFIHSSNFVIGGLLSNKAKLTYKMTNAGLSIHLPMVQAWSYHLGILNARMDTLRGSVVRGDRRVCVPIRGILSRESNLRGPMRRLRFPSGPVPISTSRALNYPHVYIRSIPDPSYSRSLVPPSTPLLRKQYPFVLIFNDVKTLPMIENQLNMHGTQIQSPDFDVFPLEAFDEDRSLITVDLTSLPTGFLIQIRVDLDYRRRRVLFIGVDLRSQQLRRFCGIVPYSMSESLDYHKLLRRCLRIMKETREECCVSWGRGIKITILEEPIAGVGLFGLIYVTSRPIDVGSEDDSDTRSDAAVVSGIGFQ